MPKKTDPAEDSRPLTVPPLKVKPADMGDVRLLEAAIACTPDPLKPGRAIPATRFAEIAKCNDRTLRRYLAGNRGLPPLLREKCEGIVSDAQRRAARASAADVTEAARRVG